MDRHGGITRSPEEELFAREGKHPGEGKQEDPGH